MPVLGVRSESSFSDPAEPPHGGAHFFICDFWIHEHSRGTLFTSTPEFCSCSPSFAWKVLGPRFPVLSLITRVQLHVVGVSPESWLQHRFECG